MGVDAIHDPTGAEELIDRDEAGAAHGPVHLRCDPQSR